MPRNRLADALSPYLRQHAGNPVDWYPWGNEALAKARSEHKPLFVSIGYAACHWCHVMERESFEDETVADLLNRHFIAIKVDREERPDLDEFYMNAVQLLTRQGGWPLNVFLTPDLKPFYGGTYFPPRERYGIPSFTTILVRIAELWDHQRADLLNSADTLTEAIRDSVRRESGGTAPLSPALVAHAVTEARADFDAERGGFGRAPKFPPALSLGLLLAAHHASGDRGTLRMVTTTLDGMAAGGLFDHLGGGFHRYSTDDRWLVPHFEKMLYDQALLVPVYLDASAVPGIAATPVAERYRLVAAATLDYVLRELTDPAGGFRSSQEADSEGEEGRYYVWTPAEIEAILGADAAAFCQAYDVTLDGNFAGRNIPNRIEASPGPDLTAARRALLAARAKRVPPGLDDKVITGWNGLMISAFCRGAQVLGDSRYTQTALRAARFITERMMPQGQLLHTWRAGSDGGPAFADDYAHLGNACLDLYETTLDRHWLDQAEALLARLLAEFKDEHGAGVYLASTHHDALPARAKPWQDNVLPSANAALARLLLRLGHVLDRTEYRSLAEQTAVACREMLDQYPSAFGAMLQVVGVLCSGIREIVITGPREAPQTQALIRTAQAAYQPARLLLHTDPQAPHAAAIAERLPLLRGKGLVKGAPAAYVCESGTCQTPVTTPAELAALLA